MTNRRAFPSSDPARTPDLTPLLGQRQAQLGAAKSTLGIAATDYYFRDRWRDRDPGKTACKRRLPDMRLQENPLRQQCAVRSQHFPAIGIVTPAGVVMAKRDAETKCPVSAPLRLRVQHIRFASPESAALMPRHDNKPVIAAEQCFFMFLFSRASIHEPQVHVYRTSNLGTGHASIDPP